MDWLLIIVMLPLLAAVAVGFVPGRQRRVIRGITIGASGLSLLCALIAFLSFEIDGELTVRNQGSVGRGASVCIFTWLRMASTSALF